MYYFGNFAIGDEFTCVYQGKTRTCTVVHLDPNKDYLTVSTPEGYRSFKYRGITAMCTLKLAVTD